MAELKNNIADWKMSVSTMQDTLLGLTAKKFLKFSVGEVYILKGG